MNKLDIVKEIKRVLDVQAASLIESKKTLGLPYSQAVELIFKCKGKVIVTGVGKSGLIAEKIASTLSSTGTPAIFLHPVEAMHGNLGIVHRNDIVIAIGKSGESEEILNILPSIRKIGAKIIALTSNKNSSLAEQSSLVLWMPIGREACPMNLAPTTSSTVAMVLGDALAIALMKKRGFGPDHFALYHPGGLLGKKLLLKISDVMRGGRKNPVCRIDMGIHHLLVEIARKWTGAANIVDKQGKLLGLVTDYDIRQMIIKRKSIMDLQIRDLMNPTPTVVYADDSIMKAVQIMEMRKKPFTVLPVIDRKKRSVGMIHLHDLVLQGLTKNPLD